MMRFVVCLSALIGLASATRAKDMKDESFAWPWDRDSHHAVPHHLGGLMAARAKVHHGNMFDTSSSDFSLDSDSDSSSSGGDFMDQYIKETGQKPLQVDSDKPKSEKQDSEPSIPDMASLFNDNSNAQEQSKPQQPWADQSSSSASSNMDSLFGGSFGFDTSSKAVDTFDTPAKPARHVDSDSHTDDMTNLFGQNQDDTAAKASTDSVASGDAAAATSDSTSGWPWDTHPKKKESEEHHSRDLWSSHSDSDTASGNTAASGNSAASDMENLFGGSASGSTSNSMFSGWSNNDFGSKSPSSNDFGVSQPAQAPQQDDAPQRSADSPIQGPTQRESSISGASATDQVVDVRLSSELQQSLLQARNAETKMLQRFRGVSN